MNRSKGNLFFMAAAVATAGIVAGTILWLKLAPKPSGGAWNRAPLERLDRYGIVPDFSLVERSGKTVALADMRGHVWIADFIYTSCEDTCPMQSAAMAQLQERWKSASDLKLVSFSVDPRRDTPPVLSQYADRFNADPKRWLFLTGTEDEMTRLVQGGFRLSAAALSDGRTKQPIILHSPRFVLIDSKNEIRGYYDSRDREALDRLNEDLAKLLDPRGSR